MAAANFDEIIERQNTYSAKWMRAGGSSLDYKNPAVRLPFQVADMHFCVYRLFRLET